MIFYYTNSQFEGWNINIILKACIHTVDLQNQGVSSILAIPIDRKKTSCHQTINTCSPSDYIYSNTPNSLQYEETYVQVLITPIKTLPDSTHSPFSSRQWLVYDPLGGPAINKHFVREPSNSAWGSFS